MPILTVDPFRRLNLPRSADPELIQKAYERCMESAEDKERRKIEQDCALLLHPDGRRIARQATPICRREFSELIDTLPPRPQFLGPGSWKKLLRRIQQVKESHRES